jgi:hypothetical protein
MTFMEADAALLIPDGMIPKGARLVRGISEKQRLP